MAHGADPTLQGEQRDITSWAHARVHNGWAGWQATLAYVDPHEEAEFVAKDFAAMLKLHLCMMGLEFFVLPLPFLPAFERSRVLTAMAGVISIIQMAMRVYLVRWKDQYKACNTFAVVAYLATFAMWVAAIFCDWAFAYAPISDKAIVIVLFYIMVLIQGTILGSVVGYRVDRVGLVYLVFPPVCGLHLYLHVPPPESTLLVTREEFLAVYVFIITVIAVSCSVQVHARRIHLAELAGLAEHYQRQRDRLQYDRIYSSGGGGSNLLKGGPASTYGTNSELGSMPEVESRLSTLTHSFSPILSPKAEEREAALWRTLDCAGLIPKAHDD